VAAATTAQADAQVCKVWIAREQNHGIGSDLVDQIEGIYSHQQVDVGLVMVVATWNAVLGNNQKTMDAQPVDEAQFTGSQFLKFRYENRRQTYINHDFANGFRAITLVEQVFADRNPVDALVEASGR
jgi:hypothetical protein